MAYGRNLDKRQIGMNIKQLALIHVAKRDLNLTEDDYRNILELYGGVSSAKHLTLEGFERVMAHLESLGFKNTNEPEHSQPKRAPFRDADGAPYPAQLRMIENLFGQLGFNEPQRRQGFCKKIIKTPWPQTRGEANKIFEALKAMLARGYEKKQSEGR